LGIPWIIIIFGVQYSYWVLRAHPETMERACIATID
jgi:hypothetical protein